MVNWNINKLCRASGLMTPEEIKETEFKKLLYNHISDYLVNTHNEIYDYDDFRNTYDAELSYEDFCSEEYQVQI